MAAEYEYAYFEGGVTVERDDDGRRYVPRSRLKRALWMLFGLVFAGLVAFMLLVEMNLLTILFWGGGIVALLGGILAEPILGSTRSDVRETDEGVYVEMIPVTRGMATAAFLFATWWGLSMLFQLVSPTGAAQYARTTGWILVLADVIPFGELLLGGVALLVAAGLFLTAKSGYTEIEPPEEFPETEGSLETGESLETEGFPETGGPPETEEPPEIEE